MKKTMFRKTVIFLIIFAVLLIGAMLNNQQDRPRSSLENGPRANVFESATPNLTPGDYNRELADWPGRPYTVHIPAGYDPSKRFAAVLAIHGGGANSEHAAKVTCPNGDIASPKCLSQLADKEGFLVIYPNGASHPGARDIRTWNAGGGEKGYLCVSGYACKNKMDDIEYFRDLLDDLEKTFAVDKERVFATGISNGAAMSHRLACELSDRIAAIAPVAGANQFSAASPCAPLRPVPVLQIHGTEDPSWPYLGGPGRRGTEDEGFFAAPKTVSEWVLRNGCDPTPQKESLPDRTRDGTRVIRESYAGCRDNADVVFMTINGGGHTWPQGNQYLSEVIIGKTSEDINANEVVWEFFKKHPMPEGAR